MKHRIMDALRLFQELQKVDSEFPLQYAICFCEIAMDEGLSLTALAQRTDMPLSTVSRIVGALSSKRQRGTPFELVSVSFSATERRKKEIYLTSRGKAVMGKLVGIMDNARAERLRA